MDKITRGLATAEDQELLNEYKVVHLREGPGQNDTWEIESVDSDVEIIC